MVYTSVCRNFANLRKESTDCCAQQSHDGSIPFIPYISGWLENFGKFSEFLFPNVVHNFRAHHQLLMHSISRDFIIVRHSERLDEIAPEQWLESVKNTRSNRDKYSVENDTPITAAGAGMAADAAKTVKSIISTRLRDSSSLGDLNVRIYSSRLMRCVQTAHQIAQELGLPIHVSSGLSLTAVAVGRRKMTFQFQSLRELSGYCPGTQLHSCDYADDPYRVKSSDWLKAIVSIVRRDEINIIVAHRETIRNLIGERYRLPYCCIGMFQYLGDRIVPKYLWDKDGRMLEDYTLPLPDMTTEGAVEEGDDAREEELVEGDPFAPLAPTKLTF